MTDAKIKHITTPLTAETIKDLHAGDVVRITGPVYTARDAAHKRMTEAMAEGRPLPFDIKGQVVYYVGPSPTKPGEIVGSAGPTTSGRMDKYTPALIAEGMRGMIGKGLRGKEVVEACVKYGAVYFVAVGGAAAVISQSIKGEKMIAYEDFGAGSYPPLRSGGFSCYCVHRCRRQRFFIKSVLPNTARNKQHIKQ